MFPPSPTPMFPSSSSSDVLPPLMSLPDTTSTPSPPTVPPSSISESVSDGAASHVSAFHPSKPFLLYATLFVNNTLLHTLIDTGASATCVNLQVLQQLSNVRYADRQSRSFLLADGVLPLSSTGLVELSMNINNACISFYALTAEKLCVDLILGMDFMIAFHAIIDIHSQQLSINVANQRIIIPVDDPLRRPLVPIRAARFTCIPPQSSVDVMISCPISCLSAYFLPASTFFTHSSLSCSQLTIQVQHHYSSLRVLNHSSLPHEIPRHFCLGYLLSHQAQLPSYIDQLSVLCRRQNEKKNAQLFPAIVVSTESPSFGSLPSPSIADLPAPLPTSASPSLCSLPSPLLADLSAMLPTPELPQPMAALVHHLVDPYRKRQFSLLLNRYTPLFDNSRHNISDIVIENVFNTVPHTPPAFRPHRNPHTREETRRLIDEFLEAGLIRESNSPYAAPAFIVPRKDDRPGRLVVDYRALNRITIPDASPLPHGEDLLQELGKGYTCFSKLDLKSGYHQFRLPSVDCAKTAFVVSQGHYEYLVLSMGPQNAPAAFQKMMSQIMKPCRDFSIVYLDDIVLFSKTFDEHLHHLQLVFDVLSKAKLVLNVVKCELAVESVIALGHKITATTITPTDDAIQDILALTEPRTLKEANKFLGGLAYYRKFVPGFADIAAPIHKVTNLTKSRRHLFQWSSEQSAAFRALKQLLTSAPLFLRFPIEGFPLQLATDASGIATGGVLYQDINGERHNLFYHSKLLSVVEQKYSVPEKEALAIFLCLQRMRTLVLGRPVYIHTDHCPICGMLQKPVNNRRIERVANLIQEYQIVEMKHIDGKANCLADFLSRPFDDPLFDLPYGLESKLPLDGASDNPQGGHSLQQLSAMTLRPRSKPIPHHPPAVASRELFLSDDDHDSIMSDDDLGSVTSARGLDSDNYATDLDSDISATDLDFDHPDDRSIHSSASSTSSALFLSTVPSPNTFDASLLLDAQQRDPDIIRICHQLTDCTAPSSITSSFTLQNNILHKLVSPTSSSTSTVAIPYLPSSMINSLLIATHDDPYQGGHFSVDKMYSKLRSRYWWPRMRHSIQQHVRACVACQQYNFSREKPPGYLHPMAPTAVPFSIIGIDYCGPFVMSSSDNKYVLVVTDLFTRFVTAVPLPVNTANITAVTLFRHVFCKYGVCSTLISDQGSHFNNHLMRAFQHLLGYHHILSTPYHPQSNGIVERFNASMVIQISKLHQQHHNNWDAYLDAVVFAYNTSQHKTTKFSPFELLFGRSPQLPIDDPPREFSFDRPNDCFVHLQRVLDVYHQQAKANILSQQSSSKIRYDHRRRDPHYKVGDPVFTKIFTSRTKLDPRYSADPQIIIDLHHPTYTVRNLTTGTERSYHVSDLRPVLVDVGENLI
ncbi:unnamed protein product [Adineta ricciae]|nr:unnamed protein product [Adineta ricciae]